MQWGPMRKVARKVYDTLGLHGKVVAAAVDQLGQDEGVHVDPLHRRGRHDQPRRPRDRRHRRPRRLREGARRRDGPPGELRGPEDRQEARQGDRQARGGLQGQVRRPGARHPDGAGRGLLAHPREVRLRGRRLGERRPPHRGHDRGGRAEREAVRAAAGADRHGADARGGARRAHRGEAHRPRAARDRRHRRADDRARGDRGRRAPARRSPAWATRPR